jgi:type I restriction enzyme M protein
VHASGAAIYAIHEVVITNPLFGKKSSITVVNEEDETDKQSVSYSRPDFWTTTSNKQLNFLQHVKSLLERRLSAH